jgi:hypothetical protein
MNINYKGVGHRMFRQMSGPKKDEASEKVRILLNKKCPDLRT